MRTTGCDAVPDAAVERGRDIFAFDEAMGPATIRCQPDARRWGVKSRRAAGSSRGRGAAALGGGEAEHGTFPRKRASP